MASTAFLQRKATQIRIELLKMIHRAGMGHTGSSLGNTDILTVLFYDVMRLDPARPKWEDRDRFIMSKGHAVESYYCILADLGFFAREELRTYCQFGSRLIGHPNNKVPGVEMNTGALGHGLAVSVGMAKAAKMDGRPSKVYTLMGDGEQAEGSVWEAAMAAAHYKLDNLVGLIDRNLLQISGTTEEVMAIEPLRQKWESFGWFVVEVEDGNSIEQLAAALHRVPETAGKPTLILCRTVKGKGVSFAENAVKWHHHVPNDEQLKLALDELAAALEELA